MTGNPNWVGERVTWPLATDDGQNVLGVLNVSNGWVFKPDFAVIVDDMNTATQCNFWNEVATNITALFVGEDTGGKGGLVAQSDWTNRA